MTAHLNQASAEQTPKVSARLSAWIERFGQWPAPVLRALKIGAAVIGVLLLVAVVTAPLDLQRQFAFAGLCFAALLMLRKLPGRLPVLAMVVLSLVATLRYV